MTTLEAFQITLGSGYAFDIIQSFRDGTAMEQDADSLFRTLVLDEEWCIEMATEAYHACMFQYENDIKTAAKTSPHKYDPYLWIADHEDQE